MDKKDTERSVDVRKIVISHWKDGKWYRENIGKIIGRNFTTVKNIIKKYQVEGTVENKSGRRRKKILNAGEEFVLLQDE